MKRILVLLAVMVGISFAEVPKIFSVSVKDTSSTTMEISLTVNTPVAGFLLISFRNYYGHSEYLLDNDTIGADNAQDMSVSPTFYEPVEGGEHIIKFHSDGLGFKQINVLYIPQRQNELGSVSEDSNTTNNTIYPLGYVVSNNGGTLYNKLGQGIMSIPSNTKINIKELSHGTYYLKSKTQTTKIVIP